MSMRSPARAPFTDRLLRRTVGLLDRGPAAAAVADAPVDDGPVDEVRPEPGRTTRRSFLARTAVVGSALTVSPFDFILRPGTAYASVCGTGASCSSGWTAFCCTINSGRNSCPPNSFIAGWWKADGSSFCCGAARYIYDCNATCPTQCGCRCASGTCDQRRVCCNQFRYGQCHQEISCYGPVVCRVATCAPPWQYDAACTSSSATDNRTVSHNAPCLPGGCDTPISRKYREMGGASGILGPVTQAERRTANNRGSRALYQNGGIWHTNATGAHEVHGGIEDRYRSMGYESSALGFPVIDESGGLPQNARFNRFEHGSIYAWFGGIFAVHTGIYDRYKIARGPQGSLGFPIGQQYQTGDRLGQTQRFEKGQVYSVWGLGAFSVSGPTYQRYAALGGYTSPLGYPTAEEAPIGDGRGRYQRFQHGSIHRSSVSPVCAIWGGHYDVYKAAGGPTGPLGYTMQEEKAVSDGSGRVTTFQFGAIYASMATGIHEVHGPIHTKYLEVGGPTGSFGYPKTNVERVGSILRVVFQGGRIDHDPGTGTTTAFPS